MNNQEPIKFEFLLTLEKNIICQRFFNVRNYNPEARRSLDIHYCVKEICEEIFQDLKTKTLDYLHENQEYILGLDDVESTEISEKEFLLLSIKMGEEVFIQRVIPAYFFHPKVRYTVDIRPNLKRYLSELTEILSSEEVETEYLNYKL